MFCPNCGSELPDDAMFCASCGTKMALDKDIDKIEDTQKPNQASDKNNIDVDIEKKNINTELKNYNPWFIVFALLSLFGLISLVIYNLVISNLSLDLNSGIWSQLIFYCGWIKIINYINVGFVSFLVTILVTCNVDIYIFITQMAQSIMPIFSIIICLLFIFNNKSKKNIQSIKTLLIINSCLFTLGIVGYFIGLPSTIDTFNSIVEQMNMNNYWDSYWSYLFMMFIVPTACIIIGIVFRIIFFKVIAKVKR